MKYSEAEQFLINPETAKWKFGLNRVEELIRLLDLPGRKMHLIHVVGTNGKGSTASLLSGILSASGYRVGSFLSPRLTGALDYYRLNGEYPSKEAFSKACDIVKAASIKMEDAPTEFELATVIALVMFEQEGCDYCIMEAGLGGGKDATNLSYPAELTIMTHIAVDHTDYLGNSISDIISEKFAITKPGETCVIAPNSTEVLENVRALAVAKKVTLLESENTDVDESIITASGLKGAFQSDNLKTVLTAVNQLREIGAKISEEAIISGVSAAHLPFRFMLEKENPDLIFDGGHNPDCMDALLKSLKTRNPNATYTVVTGVMRDKEYATVYDMLDSVADSYITLTAPNKRALSAKDLGEYLTRFGKPVYVSDSLEDAAMCANSALSEGKNVLCAGSFYFLADIYRLITGKEV